MKVDTAAIEQEISNYEKQLRQSYSTKSKLMEEIDSLDPDDKHYYKRKADLDDRLYKMYDKIEDTESLLIEARVKKMAIEAEKLTGDNIYKVLIYFDKLYAVMDELEKRQIMEELLVKSGYVLSYDVEKMKNENLERRLRAYYFKMGHKDFGLSVQ